MMVLGAWHNEEESLRAASPTKTTYRLVNGVCPPTSTQMVWSTCLFWGARLTFLVHLCTKMPRGMHYTTYWSLAHDRGRSRSKVYFRLHYTYAGCRIHEPISEWFTTMHDTFWKRGQVTGVKTGLDQWSAKALHIKKGHCTATEREQFHNCNWSSWIRSYWPTNVSNDWIWCPSPYCSSPNCNSTH